MESEQRIQQILKGIQAWLRPDNERLKAAVGKTVDGGYFSLPDVRHQIRSLKKTLDLYGLRRMVDRSGRLCAGLQGKTVIALHAGNLPLTGVQDLLAILLSGASYAGKVSRKDPWLLPSLLEELRSAGVAEIEWSVDLEGLKAAGSDALLFSGSDRSVDNVREKVNQLRLLRDDARMLIRTAHYSLACIGDHEPGTLEELTEAVFRYGGKGCRSVAVVFAPFSLDEIKCAFTDYIEAFWLRNPQHEKPPPALYHRYAYNKSVGISQSWLDHFLIQERNEPPSDNFLLNWIQGEPSDAAAWIERHGDGLQTVYTTGDTSLPEIEKLNISTEALSTAQQPPIDWCPDGIDTIAWLCENVGQTS